MGRDRLLAHLPHEAPDEPRRDDDESSARRRTRRRPRRRAPRTSLVAPTSRRTKRRWSRSSRSSAQRQTAPGPSAIVVHFVPLGHFLPPSHFVSQLVNCGPRGPRCRSTSRTRGRCGHASFGPHFSPRAVTGATPVDPEPEPAPDPDAEPVDAEPEWNLSRSQSECPSPSIPSPSIPSPSTEPEPIDAEPVSGVGSGAVEPVCDVSDDLECEEHAATTSSTNARRFMPRTVTDARTTYSFVRGALSDSPAPAG